MDTKPSLAAATAALIVAAVPFTALGEITTFDDGRNGWSVSGRTDVSLTGGNPGANLDVVLTDVFGADIRDDDGGPQDFTSPTTLTVDVKIDSIDFFGSPVPREFVVEVIDRDNGGDNGFASVFFPLGVLDGNGSDWTTYAVTIEDTSVVALPTGWRGAGSEDPVTFEPILPAGRTFADVLAGADELRFTTFVPGFFFGFTNFDMQVDNVGFTAVPEPASLGLLALAAVALRRRR